jgi:2-oxoglutarate ferredoxin oxidoreductase subunit beta
MPALVAGIHVFVDDGQDVDGRDKPGHDEVDWTAAAFFLDHSCRTAI